MERLSLASLPYRVQRAADRAFEEIAEHIEQQVRAFCEGDLDQLDGLDGKGNVKVGLTLTLDVSHNVRDGITRFDASVKVKPPKRSGVAGTTLVYRHGEGLLSTSEDPDRAQLDLLKPKDADSEAAAPRPQIVR